MSDATPLTPEKIDQYRIEFADNENALIALDIIEEWEVDLADAPESIAPRNSIKGVEDNADFRQFAIVLNKCRDFIYQPKYENLREKYLPALIPTLTNIIVGYLMYLLGFLSITEGQRWLAGRWKKLIVLST